MPYQGINGLWLEPTLFQQPSASNADTEQHLVDVAVIQRVHYEYASGVRQTKIDAFDGTGYQGITLLMNEVVSWSDPLVAFSGYYVPFVPDTLQYWDDPFFSTIYDQRWFANIFPTVGELYVTSLANRCLQWFWIDLQPEDQIDAEFYLDILLSKLY